MQDTHLHSIFNSLSCKANKQHSTPKVRTRKKGNKTFHLLSFQQKESNIQDRGLKERKIKSWTAVDPHVCQLLSTVPPSSNHSYKKTNITQTVAPIFEQKLQNADVP